MVHVQAIMEAPFGNAHECLWQGLRFAVVSQLRWFRFPFLFFCFCVRCWFQSWVVSFFPTFAFGVGLNGFGRLAAVSFFLRFG